MTAMTDTSLLAYASILPTLTKRQKEVLRFMQYHNCPITNKELASTMGRPINEITPRCNELVKKGIVEEKGRKRDEFTGRVAILWGIVNRQQGTFDF